jgi:hypothetical protein
MARITGYLVALAVLAFPAVAVAQDTASALPDRPRLEFGAGGSIFHSGGTMPYTEGMIDARVGVRLSRNWSLEGLAHFMPETWTDVSGYYRVPALWRIGGGVVQPFLAFGGAGELIRYSRPEYRYSDYYTGEPRVIPAGSYVSMTAPWYPTASVGFEKVLASHLAVRAELTTAFGVNEYGVAAAFVPGVSVSIPIGRYVTKAGR